MKAEYSTQASHNIRPPNVNHLKSILSQLRDLEGRLRGRLNNTEINTWQHKPFTLQSYDSQIV